MVLPITGHVLFPLLLVLSTMTDMEAFLFDADSCARLREYKDLINLAHVENCLSVDQVFSKLKALQDQPCLNHLLSQLGDRYGVSVQTPEDCQCNGSNSLLTYQTNVQDGTADRKDVCLSHNRHYKALFDQFFVDNGNNAPSCRSHHSVWYELSQMNDNGCARDLIYHLTYSFGQHPSKCHCQQILHYGVSNNCSQFHSYQALLRLQDGNVCTSKNSQWDLLHDLELRSPECRRDIITKLAMHFKNSLAADSCQCHPVVNISNANASLEEGKRSECSHVSGSSYNDLYHALFDGARAEGCATHFRLWQQLQDIQPWNGYDCTMDLILRSANKYTGAASDPCKCSESSPTTTKTTTTTTTATTTPIAATTTVPPQRFHCRKFDLIADIANGHQVQATGSTPCESRVTGTNEDLVLSLCNMTSADTWTRGAQVISHCKSIPSYSPVATFGTTGKYQPDDAQSGIFLECIAGGFKMAIQPCDGGPQIIHVETTGAFFNNASIYYAVV